MKTPNRILTILTALSTTIAAISMSACAPKKPAAETPSSPEATSADISSDMADSDSGKAMGLETVHYAYDSSTLDAAAKKTLNANAGIMKDKTNLKIQIEGHTDERGGIQYNIALGERRANAAKAFLVDHGVAADRVTTISYGKEKPVDQGHDDSAWSKNRRANFRVTEK
ncbi:MAG: peptidoglycan-associated lipoprotein Pal [Deltaproteobacteria bacterium]|nr:peptidoglycan-associated lipoprotein Pal [Deltaproteobacteria bacterium]